MLRLGIVDFDSSHAIEFTRRFNHVGVDRDQFVDGARVEVAWPGTSEMAPERIAGFSEQVASCGVELVDAPDALIGRIDAVLVLSLCGGAHLERARPFLEAGIPTFVDKPFTCSVAEAIELVRLSETHGTPLFTSSALPFADEVTFFHSRAGELGPTYGVLTYGPAHRAAGNPGLFHYGIHAVAILYALMGPGCESVAALVNDGADHVSCRWKDGRFATLRASRAGSTAYGFLAFTENGVIHQHVSARYAYRNLCHRIVESITSRRPAVSHSQSVEIVRFAAAAIESEKRGGESVLLDGVC